MSYDLRIGIKVDGFGEIVPVSHPNLDEPTYNLGKMFRECMDWDFNQGEWYNCKDVFPKISQGIMQLTTMPLFYREYEPGNGWGTVETAVAVLKSLRECIQEWSEIVPMEYLWVRW